jgi:hypothetical protein
MNGRVYDPLAARFLSPDPFVNDAANGQSYNRYTYVLNNPTNLVDPSGYEECESSSYCSVTRSLSNAANMLGVIAVNAQRATTTGVQKVANQSPRIAKVFGQGFVFRANSGASANTTPATQTYVGMGKDGVPYTYEGPAAEPKSTWQKVKDGAGDFVEGALHAAEGIPGEGVAVAGVVRIVGRAGNSNVIGALEKGAGGLSGLSFGEMRSALTTAQDAYKGSTVIGHALSKHAGRNPQIWGRITGSMKTWNDQAMKQLRDIVRAPGEFEEKAYDGIKFLEKRMEDGRGVRLNMDSTFKGFID